jgi:tetratricopeptide (TPR) repeat protein
MTFPSLQQRWQNQPQRGEVIGVSASVLGDMVGFAIAELLPNLKAEIISLFVDPNHRQKGVGTKMLAFLEREIGSQKVEQIALVYAPTPLADRALTSMFRKLGWAAPRSLANGLKVALKGLPTVNPAISGSAKVKFEEGKNQVKDHNLEQAVICFQEAIRLQPDYVAAYNQLGNALQTLEQSDEAIACYQKILEINPNVAAAHCNLGSIWQTQEKFEAAIAAYQRAIKLKPDFALAHRNLSGLVAKDQTD